MQTEEKDALTELYARNVDAVYRICYVYLRHRADAEDAVQSVFLKYLQKRPAFRGPEHEQGWLLLTAKTSAVTCCARGGGGSGSGWTSCPSPPPRRRTAK